MCNETIPEGMLQCASNINNLRTDFFSVNVYLHIKNIVQKWWFLCIRIIDIVVKIR